MVCFLYASIFGHDFGLFPVAPVFFNLNATTVSARHGAVVLLEGDYFVNTTTILVRVTIEDGSVKTGTAQFVSRTLLLLRLPSHNVPLYIYGLSARLEVAFHTDDLGNPYWQVVSPLSNDATKAMKLQYFGKCFCC